MLFYVIAVLLGVWQTLRKLDVRQREAEHYPGVDRKDFEVWKSRALNAYNLGSFSCFAYIPLDLALPWLAPRIGMSGDLLRVLGFGLFLAWVSALVAAGIGSSRARGLQRKLGIVLESRAPEPRPPK